MVLDILADRISATFKSHKSNALVAEGRISIGGPKVILAKPLSYMNTSGGPVSSLMKFYDIPVDHVLVVHDELDIDAGAVRVKVGGGHAGHNGLRDIIAAAGSPEFARIRVGVGHPPGRQDAADFVLKDFSSTERKDVLPLLLEQSADAIEAVVTAGTAEAQQKFNVR
jgi:PTH1 family peptidyl-tRNA hydrolase